MIKKIAIVDDDIEMGKVIKEILSTEGYEASYYTSAAEALVSFTHIQPQVVLTDIKMKDIDGLMFLKKIKSDYPEIVTVMMTAFGSIETAIEAMKLGAYHYLEKPFSNEELKLLISRAFERSQLKNENAELKTQLNKSFTFESIIGKSPSMQTVFSQIRLVSAATCNVLIYGDSGTGKELVARAIHNSGSRKDQPFVAINCTAIPEALLESELFGHVRGSFTGATNTKIGLFEEANKGTIFLDEIGDLSLPLQAKLLRVIQEKEIKPVGDNKSKKIDVRILTATHRDLKTMSTVGKFREDLYYRLNVITIKIPPLKERIEDIPLLVENFLKKHSQQFSSPEKKISSDAMQVLMAHNWPGNVRELENVIERAIVLCQKESIEKEILLDCALTEAKNTLQNLYLDRPSLEKIEERYIKLILSEVNFDKNMACKTLGISKRTLYRKAQILGLFDSEPNEENSPDDDAQL